MGRQYGQGGPWDLATYEATVEKLAGWAHAFARARPGVRVAWLSTNPMPLNGGARSRSNRRLCEPFCPFSTKVWVDMTHCPPTDWRLPHLIAAYNRVAARVVRRLNVTYLNLWQPFFDLQELSHDTVHYLDPTGRAAALCALQWIAGDGSPAVKGCWEPDVE